MGRWIRVDVQWHDDPKAIKARGWGMVVVRAVWEIVKAKYSAGTMPAECWDAEYIARWSLFYEERGGVRGIERGMTQALASGMLERGDDGSIVVPNWRRYQVDATAAERKAKHLSKKTAHLQGDGTGENGSERIGTEGTFGNDRQDRTGQDNTHTQERAPVYPLNKIQQRIWGSYARHHEEKYSMLPPQGGQAWQTALDSLAPVISDVLVRDGVPDARIDKAIDAFMEKYFCSEDEKVIRAKHAIGLLPHRITDIVTEVRGGRS